MSDLDTTIKFLGWALSKAEEMRAYTEPSSSAIIQRETLIDYIESALIASRRLFQGSELEPKCED